MNKVKILSTNIENVRMHQTEITQLKNTITEMFKKGGQQQTR